MSFDTKPGSFERMKQFNQSTVLNMIRLKEPISRADIAKLTKLTKPTVSTIVSELLEKNLVTEEEATNSTVAGGRKPFLLRMNYSAYYIIGVYAAAEVIRVIMSTMDGKIVSDNSKRIFHLPSEDEFMDIIFDSIYHVLHHSKVKSESILGIGVAMHGLVDPDRGIAIFSPHLHLENIPIKEILEKKFDLPVIIENDVRALAIAESWFGQGQGVSDFVCLSVGLGIGSGIFIKNEIYRSPFNTGGEIGHTIIEVNGPKCECGNNGCLEAYASEIAIFEKVKRELDHHQESIIYDWIKVGKSELSLDMVFEAAKEGDPFAIGILEETGRSLGLAAANMVNILKPSKLILEGYIFEQGDFIVTPLKEMIEKYNFKSSHEHISVVCSKLGKTGMVLGAVTLILHTLFKTDN